MNIVLRRVKNIVPRIAQPLKSGANPVSLWLRRRLEKISIRELIGINLAGLTFFSAIILPQTNDVLASAQVATKPTAEVIEVVPTIPTFQWPMAEYGLSQRFSYFHPGIDMTAPNGTPIYPAAEGEVLWINFFRWGYGNHVLIKHNNNAQSLYAHLSRVLIKPGDRVTRQTVLGEVGSTGWSTGNHLHFEVYQDGAPVNPLEVLPEKSIATNK